MQPDLEYRRHLSEGRFMLQRCCTRGRYVFYPRIAEPRSGSTDLEWVEASGRGTVYAAVESGARAYAQARVKPDDIDVLQLYEAFTINPILFLEDLRFCPKGEGGRFVEGGRIAPGGALSVNTNGGGLSCCHSGMDGLFTLVESTRQLRGDAGPRQVAGARLALAHGNGGMLSSQATVILGTRETL